MKLTFSDKKSALLGALIGLARASENENGMPDTGLVFEAICALANKNDDNTDALKNRVTEAKRILAPDCFTCSSPCGRTADYDISQIVTESDNIAQLKYLLLEKLISAAYDEDKISGFEGRLDLMLEALFTIGYDADEGQLEDIISKLDN